MEKEQKNYRYDESGNEILERYFGRLAVQQLLRSVQGSVLTVIEAAIADKAQLESVKSLIKQEISRRQIEIHELALDEPHEDKDSDIQPNTHQAYGCVLHLYENSSVISHE
jgi:predicted regulator of amino acid metabolism with ACT domain